MGAKLWLWFTDTLVGKLPEPRRRRAEKLVLELWAIFIEKGAEGAVRGLRDD